MLSETTCQKSRHLENHFFTNDISRVSTLINQVLTTPDNVERHRWDATKTVLKKNFHFAIGVHGFTSWTCFTLMVTLNI